MNTLKKRKVLSIVSVLLISIVVGSLPLSGFAVNSDETSPADESLTYNSEVYSEITNAPEGIVTEDIQSPSEHATEVIAVEGVLEPPIEITPPETETDVAMTVPSTAANTSGEYSISFSLYNLEKAGVVTITLVNDANNKEYKIKFDKSDDYFVTMKLPVGSYTVKEVETNSRFVKVSIDTQKFEVKANDLQNYRISCTEKQTNGFLRFLLRNWFLLLALIGLLIAYGVVRKRAYAA